MSRKRRSFVGWLLVIVMQLTSILPMATVYAVGGGEKIENIGGEEITTPGGMRIQVSDVTLSDTEFQFITSVIISDENGVHLTTKEDIGKSSEVHITYSFEIPNAYDLGVRDPYSLQLPDEIKIENPMEIPLKDVDDKLMATVYVTTNGTVRIEFTEHASSLSDIEGHFKIETKFDEERIQNDEETTIEFDLGGSAKQLITVKFEVEDETTIVNLTKKSLGYDVELNEITWEITVKPQTSPNLRLITNVVITDAIQEGQTYVPNSATIKKSQEVYIDGSFNYSAPNLTYTFNNPINQVKNEEYTITLKTKPDLSAFEGKNQGDIISF